MGRTITVDPFTRDPKRHELRDKIRQLNERVKANWDNDEFRGDLAQEISEEIYLGFEHENLLDLLTTVERADFDGRVLLKEARGLRAFWVARGGYIEASTMRADVLELPRATIGFHVTEFEDKLRTSFAETQQTLIDLGIERLDAEVNLLVLQMLQAAVPPGSDQYISGSGLDLTELNNALTSVRDESRTNEITIVGRGTMVDQIMNELTSDGANAGFLPESNEEFLRKGSIGTYRGARIVTLKNYRDDMDIPFFPANELFVVARDASKFAFWGGLLAKEFTELDDWRWHYIARRDFGGVVHRPNRLRRIVDNDIAPYAVVEQ